MSNHPFFIGVCAHVSKHRAFHLGTIYLIRHGQAGTREHYDVLSDLGEQQAVLLGQYFKREAVAFEGIYTGALRRQQQTAQLVLAQMNATVVSQCDAQWNEFSLAQVYQGMLPLLLRADASFAADYTAMQEALRADAHAVRGAVGRCDRAIITAWMNERFTEYQGESWQAFRARVQAALPALMAAAESQTIAVFTSATPIAITVSAVLGMSNEKTLGLMAMVQNSSVTTLRIRDGEAWLASFNSLAHLPEPNMRTYR